MSKYALRKTPVAAAIGALLGSGSIAAATITVTSSLDGPLGSFPDECTLRSAVAAANLGIPVDSCAAGAATDNQIVFTPDLEDSVITLSLGELEVTRALRIVGPVAGDPTGLTLNGNDSSRLFSAIGNTPGDFLLAVDGLTLRNGRTTGVSEHGGAIHLYNASLELLDTNVLNSSTLGNISYGGGVAVFRGDVNMTRATIVNNATEGDFGFGGGLALKDGNLMLVDSVIAGNSTSGDTGLGGGLYLRDGEAVMERVLITGNATTGHTAQAGGARLRDVEFFIQDSVISNNSTAGAFAVGGGLQLVNAFGYIAGSTLSGNQISGIGADGGGVWIGNGSELDLINSTVSGNATHSVSASGGGLYVASSSAAYLLHSTIAYNSASSGGAGIHKYDDDQSYLGVVGLRNSMIVQGVAGEVACNQAPASFANSLDTDGSCVSTATPLAAIALQPLADNGGLTSTHALNPSSVAINAAGECNLHFGVVMDQRGEPRPGIGSSTCDIGAFEYQVPDQIFRDRFEN